MKVRFVEAENAQHPVSLLCRMVGIARQTVYQARGRRPPDRVLEDERLLERIRAAFAVSRETYGAPRIHAELRAAGIRVGRKRVARLMLQAGLEGVSRRRARRTTTSADRAVAPAPDLVERQF